MILSGIRVRCSISGVHGLANRAGRPRPDRGLPNSPVAIHTEGDYDAVVGLATCETWKYISNSAAVPIQRKPIVSRSLRPSDSQAQPSKGTQGNHGDKTPLADGDTSRAVQSYLPLALKGSVTVQLQPFRRFHLTGWNTAILRWEQVGVTQERRRPPKRSVRLRTAQFKLTPRNRAGVGFVRLAHMLTTCAI